MLQSRLPGIILYASVKVRTAVRRAEAAIVRRAMARSRVDTGNMRGGWQSQAVGDFDGVVFNRVNYTIFNEYGTVSMAAQPMVRPAVEDTRPEFESDVRAAYL